MPKSMKGKQALLEMLKAEGVEYIFGNPGTSEGPIIDLLGDYPEFRYILALQESVEKTQQSRRGPILRTDRFR